MSKTESTPEPDLGEAGAQLSTAPTEERSNGPVGIGVLGWIRWFWRQPTANLNLLRSAETTG